MERVPVTIGGLYYLVDVLDVDRESEAIEAVRGILASHFRIIRFSDALPATPNKSEET